MNKHAKKTKNSIFHDPKESAIWGFIISTPPYYTINNATASTYWLVSNGHGVKQKSFL